METSDGKRHRGRDAAEAHQNQIDAANQRSTVDNLAGTRKGEKLVRAADKARAHREVEAAAEPVVITQLKVTANPKRWGRGQWQGAHMVEPIRFDQNGVAWLTVERDGERIEVDFVGPSGPFKAGIDEIVRRHADFVVTDETRELEVAS